MDRLPSALRGALPTAWTSRHVCVPCACGGGGSGGELELMARSGCVQSLIPQPLQALLGYRGGLRAQPRPCQPCREALLLELTPASGGVRGVHLAPAPAMLGSPSLGTDSPSIQAFA